MTAALKQDSNATGLAVAEEQSIGVLPMTPIWATVQPNSYKDFGAQLKLVARQPINSSRQQKKGVVVDLDAAGGFQVDLTQQSLQTFIQGVFYANFRSKNDLAVPTSTSGHYTPASGGGAYLTGDIVFGKNFTNPLNNGAKVLAADGSSSSIAATGVAAETGSSGSITRAGFQHGSGLSSTSTVNGLYGFNTDGSTGKDLTTLGLNIGEWIFLGGDTSGTFFAQATANGFGRIATISAHRIDFDKWSNLAPVDDTGTSKTIQMYFGRVIKNEQAASIVRRTYQLERILPKADSGDSFQQAEYLTKSGLDELDITMNTADKITFDLTTVSGDYETVDGSVGPKSGTRTSFSEGNLYNTTSHVKRFALSVVGNAASLFAYITQAAFTIKNNITPNKAIGVLGAFDTSAGIFEVAATLTAYFVDVASVAAIRNNDNVTLDCILCQNNAGIAIDYPLVALGDGRLAVALNQPITLPLSMDAATAVDIDANKDYTCMMVFYDYLPTRAMP